MMAAAGVFLGGRSAPKILSKLLGAARAAARGADGRGGV